LEGDLEESSVESLEEVLMLPLGAVREDFRVAGFLRWGWYRRRIKAGAAGVYLLF
jgi:hypothetical protein